MAGAMLACRDITELVTDFVERRMSLWDRLRFQLHLGMCRHCREYVRQMRRTLELTGALPHQPPPPEVEAELLRRFRSWKSA
jgi:predicted anti-sigma-YlaC factor YlaD